MKNIRDLVNTLDTIANEIEKEDKNIALAIDRVSDGIEKKAFFNQSTWLPGRTTRAYPSVESKIPNNSNKRILYVCSSCNLRRYLTVDRRCPRCGNLMRRVF